MKDHFYLIVFQYENLINVHVYKRYVVELQLKDHHQPLRMRMKWPDLLRRFTTASTEMMEKGRVANWFCSSVISCIFASCMFAHYKIFKQKASFIILCVRFR